MLKYTSGIRFGGVMWLISTFMIYGPLLMYTQRSMMRKLTTLQVCNLKTLQLYNFANLQWTFLWFYANLWFTWRIVIVAPILIDIVTQLNEIETKKIYVTLAKRDFLVLKRQKPIWIEWKFPLTTFLCIGHNCTLWRI